MLPILSDLPENSRLAVSNTAAIFFSCFQILPQVDIGMLEEVEDRLFEIIEAGHRGKLRGLYPKDSMQASDCVGPCLTHISASDAK